MLAVAALAALAVYGASLALTMWAQRRGASREGLRARRVALVLVGWALAALATARATALAVEGGDRVETALVAAAAAGLWAGALLAALAPMQGRGRG